MMNDDEPDDSDFVRWTGQQRGQPSASIPLESDRERMLNVFAEFVRQGVATLENVPDLKSQILYLQSGEIYWLRVHDIMRIQ